jgi:hypothetical protein
MGKRKKQFNNFYDAPLSIEDENSQFHVEYNVFLKTIEAVNSFYSFYKTDKGKNKGPSTHAQQDLCRAMLIFACAGLDVFVKQLIKTKLPKLIPVDNKAGSKFKEHVRRGLKENIKEQLDMIALALIDQNPREMLLKEYLDGMTGESLQSVEELRKVAEASGLDSGKIIGKKDVKIKEVFNVRNQIIHEMDINVSEEDFKSRGRRTRRQRISNKMEKYTKIILDLIKEIFVAYKNKFNECKIDTKKSLKKSP